MIEPHSATSEPDEETSSLPLWESSVGKVFKISSKAYGIRAVTYTQIKSVKTTAAPGEFDIEVLCAEITARILPGKRSHSSICKEGMIHQAEGSYFSPASFGEECPPQEFEKIAVAILAHTTSILDGAMQLDSEDEPRIDVPIDLPHLKVTEMEASFLRDSPFLLKEVYLLTPNSRPAAIQSIEQELRRASRNNWLADACDAVYVTQKNEAVISLRNKLSSAQTVEACHAAASTLRKETSVTPPPAANGHEAGAKKGVTTGQRSGLARMAMDSISLALLGKASAASLAWESLNPSKEGAVFRVDHECGLLTFVRWAHFSGRAVTDQETAGKKLRAYFNGPGGTYSGPDREGIYPLLKPES